MLLLTQIQKRKEKPKVARMCDSVLYRKCWST